MVKIVDIKIHRISDETTLGYQFALFFTLIISVNIPIPYMTSAIAGEREKKTLESLLVAPVSRMSILVAKISMGLFLVVLFSLFNMVAMLVYNQIILFMAGNYEAVQESLIPISTFPYLTLGIFLISLISISVSMVISCISVDQKTADTINRMVLMIPSIVIGIVFFLGPTTFQNESPLMIILLLVPYTHAMIFLNNLLNNTLDPFMTTLNILYMIGFSLIFLYIGTKLFHKERILT